jgi:hypothetical protein
MDLHTQAEDILDMDAINADIAAGVRAFQKLLTHASDDWTSWSITIKGFRALRDLTFARTGTSNIQSDAYRKELGAMLSLKKYSAYSHITKQVRSACYKLMDAIEEVDIWHAALPTEDKLRWKHPESIAKHVPKNLLKDGMRGHNKPKGKKKPITNAEIERLRVLLIQVIRRLAKYEPKAIDLLDELNPADPNDNVDDLWNKPDKEAGED